MSVIPNAAFIVTACKTYISTEGRYYRGGDRTNLTAIKKAYTRMTEALENLPREYTVSAGRGAKKVKMTLHAINKSEALAYVRRFVAA